jgi:hypothetical protein
MRGESYPEAAGVFAEMQNYGGSFVPHSLPLHVTKPVSSSHDKLLDAISHALFFS